MSITNWDDVSPLKIIYYKLEGTKVVACSGIEYAKGFNKSTRILKKTRGKNDLEVSTVFLGIDHNYSKEGPPLLFETMVFGVEDEVCKRYSTVENAIKGHNSVCSWYGLEPNEDKTHVAKENLKPPTKVRLRR